MTSAFPGRIRPGPEEAGITRHHVEGIRSVTIQTDTTLPKIAADIRFLAGRGRGPAVTRARVCAWAAALETDAESAFDIVILKRICHDLVVLAHSNAAFSLSWESGEWSEPILEIDDRGGYLLAQLIIAAIEKAAPISPEGLAELADHTRSAAIRQMAQIVGYLKRS